MQRKGLVTHIKIKDKTKDKDTIDKTGWRKRERE